MELEELEPVVVAPTPMLPIELEDAAITRLTPFPFDVCVAVIDMRAMMALMGAADAIETEVYVPITVVVLSMLLAENIYPFHIG